MNFRTPKCIRCKHYDSDGLGITCKAFPDSIPDVILKGEEHTAVIEGQVGDFVFDEKDVEDETNLQST